MTQRRSTAVALLCLLAAVATATAQKAPATREVTTYLAWLKAVETARRQAYDATAAKGDHAGYYARLGELQGRVAARQSAPAPCQKLHAAYLAAFALEVEVQAGVVAAVAAKSPDKARALQKRALAARRARYDAGNELRALEKALGIKAGFGIG